MVKRVSVIILAALTYLLTACTDDDSFSVSPSNLLTFSSDTVRMDTVFSTVPTAMRSFWVYNRSGDGIRCVNVRLANGNQTGFRVNVDGEYLSPVTGYQVQNVEIRNKDSIRVFVELTSPVNGNDGPQLLEDDLVFSLESGVEQRVNLNAYTWDATMMRDVVIRGDSTIDSADKPVVIYGGLRVDSMATLRIAAGTTLYFHADAGMDVYGRLISEGTPDANVTLRGDRTDNMFDYLSYDEVSGQWLGVRLHSSSCGNVMTYTDVHGTYDGVVCDSSDVAQTKLQLYNSTVHNCQGYGLLAVNCKVDVRNCQITNTLNDCVAVYGGDVTLTHCTIAQFYPFDSNRGVALRFSNSYGDSRMPLLRMDCLNSIVTGYGEDMVAGVNVIDADSTAFNYRFVGSLVRMPYGDDSVGDETADSVNFVNVIWDNDADTVDVTGEGNFRLVDIDMQKYDFRLDSLSRAIGHADKAFALPEDRDGRTRDDAPDIGCYEFFKEEE